MPHKVTLKKIPVREPNKDEKFMVEESHPSIFPPHFEADDKQISEVETWDVDNTYRLVIDVEMKSKRSDKKGTHGGFDILAYKWIKPKSIDDMSDKEFGEHLGKELSKS